MKSYICHICNSRFISNVNLKAHMEAHKDKKFTCPSFSCGKDFKTKEEVDSHIILAHKINDSKTQPPIDYYHNKIYTTSNTNSENMQYFNLMGYNQNFNIMYNGINLLNLDLLIKNNLANYGNIYFPNVYFNNY